MRRFKRLPAILGVQVATIGVFVIVWNYVAELNPTYKLLIAPPVKAFYNIPTFLTHSSLGLPTGLHALEITLLITGGATVISASLGLLLGLIIGGIKYLHSTLDPYIVAAFTIPKIILVPVFWGLFGFGVFYELWFGVIHGVFPMLVTTIYGVRSIDPLMLNVASTMGASTQQVYRKVVLPSAFQTLIGGLRLTFNASFLGVIISQILVGQIGLGYLAIDYTQMSTSFGTTNLYSLVIVTAITGMAINGALIYAERRFLRYKKA